MYWYCSIKLQKRCCQYVFYRFHAGILFGLSNISNPVSNDSLEYMLVTSVVYMCLFIYIDIYLEFPNKLDPFCSSEGLKELCHVFIP